jgi:hypothetical protein
VRKRQRRLSGVDEMVLSLYAKGLTTGEISAHFAMRWKPALNAFAVTFADRIPGRRNLLNHRQKHL